MILYCVECKWQMVESSISSITCSKRIPINYSLKTIRWLKNKPVFIWLSVRIKECTCISKLWKCNCHVVNDIACVRLKKSVNWGLYFKLIIGPTCLGYELCGANVFCDISDSFVSCDIVNHIKLLVWPSLCFSYCDISMQNVIESRLDLFFHKNTQILSQLNIELTEFRLLISINTCI